MASVRCFLSTNTLKSTPLRRYYSSIECKFTKIKHAVFLMKKSVRASQQPVEVQQTVQPPPQSFKKILVPIIDSNPYLNEGTRQAAAQATALAKEFGAEITIVVIDADEKEQIKDHDTRVKTINWHLAQGGYEEFTLIERLGEGNRPAVVIGELADDLGLDLVVLSMETIHSKHVDANLLAEFVPCPVFLVPL